MALSAPLQDAFEFLRRRTIGRMKMIHVLEYADGSMLVLDFNLSLIPATPLVPAINAYLESSIVAYVLSSEREAIAPAAAAADWERFAAAPFHRAFDFPCPNTMKNILLVAVRRES